MNEYIFLKQAQSVQLAHLYELLFESKLIEKMRSLKFYQGLDYEIESKTFYGGLIHIHIQTYTKRLIGFKKLFYSVDISLGKDSIVTAINSLVADKQSTYSSNGFDKVVEELVLLHNTMWQDMESFEILDVKKNRRKAYPLYLNEGKITPNKNLYISMIINGEIERNIIPLYYNFSHFILTNLESVICTKYGYYGQNDKYYSNIILNKLVYNIATGLSNVDLEKINTDTIELVSEMKNRKTYNRFYKKMASMSYQKYQTNNFEQIYDDTMIFVGPTGWEKIATAKNMEKILAMSVIELRQGNKKINIPLYKIIQLPSFEQS